jgi:hypothetical protein
LSRNGGTMVWIELILIIIMCGLAYYGIFRGGDEK